MSPPDAAPAGRGALRPALLLAAVLAGTKACHVAAPGSASLRESGRWLLDLALVSSEDLVYAAALGALAHLGFAATRARPRLATAAHRAYAAACVASAFYAVVHVHVFAYMRRPVTLPMIYVGGDLGNLRDSLASFVTPGLVAGLVAVPAAYGWLAFRRGGAAALRRPAGIAAASLAVAWCVAARVFVLPQWGSSHDDRQIVRNPHAAIAFSVLDAATGGSRVTFRPEFGPEEAADFAPAGARPDGGRPTEGLARGPRNVVLLVLESVGVEHLPLYGARRPVTPRMVAEARNSLVFDGVYAHVTNTANSLVALTLGVYPPGLSWREPTVETPRMPGDSLAELLRRHGRRTAFLTSGDGEYANQREFLADRGFDALRDFRDSGRERLFSWGVADEALVDMSLAWIDEDPGRPFLLVAWTQGTHHPYEIPWEREKIDFFAGGELPHDDWDLGNYLNALHETDAQFGRLLDGLAARGIAEDTIVVVTGDHGEAFGVPHGNYGHSYHVYEEDVHVPLLLWNPRLFRGTRSAAVGGHVDVLPTIADLIGLDAAPSWQGRSLLGPSHHGRAYFYGALDSYFLGVREGSMKYVVDVTGGDELLFDLAEDRLEQHDLSASRPELCASLRRRLGAWFRTSAGR